MSKGIGDDTPLGLLLNSIVPDGTGCGQPFFDVSLLENPTRPVCIVGPDTGEAVRLQLHLHLDCVGFLASTTLL